MAFKMLRPNHLPSHVGYLFIDRHKPPSKPRHNLHRQPVFEQVTFLARLQPINPTPNLKDRHRTHQQVVLILCLDPLQHSGLSRGLDQLRNDIGIQQVSQNSTFLG